MSISLEPSKGLRLKLGRHSPIRTWHGGGNFWSHEFQLTVRSGALAGFLPRAIEDEDSVLFEYRSGGTEQAGTSVAVSSMSEIPARELAALRSAVEELKRKADDPHCDRTKRQMIEGFRLPDPQKDRDLYRLIGKGSSAKLIVLWGVEREEGSALAPGAAVDLMHTPGKEAEATPAPKKSKLVPVLLLLAALSAGGWFYRQKELEKKKLAEEEAALAAQQAEEARMKAEKDRLAAFNAAAAAKNAANAAGVRASPPTTSTTAPMTPAVVASAKPAPTVQPATLSTETKTSADSKSTSASDSSKKSTETPKASAGSSLSATTSSSSKSSDADKSKSAPSPPPTATKSTTTNSSAIKSISAAPGTIVRNSSGVVTGVVAKDGKVALAKSGTVVSKDGKVTTHAPGTVIRGSSGACTGVCDKNGQVVPAKLGRIIEDAKGTIKNGPPGTLIRDSKGVITGVCDAEGKVVSAVPGTVLDKEGRITTSTPGSVLSDSFGTVTGVVDANGKIVDAAPGAFLENDSIKNVDTSTTSAATAAPDSVATPMTSKGPPPAGISSLSVVSTSLSGVLGSGNVEVLLNVVARDTAGAVINAPRINGWKVDGMLMNKPDGTPADGPVIPVSLTPGSHRISTVGLGADGQPFQTDADVLVTPKL